MLASAIIGHMVGDFVLQNDWMAMNKKLRGFPCFVHCSLWTASVLFFAWEFTPWLALWLFATNFAIDRTQFISWWMGNVSGQSGFAENLKPWSLIAVDNTFHLITLWIGFKFMV